MNPKTTARPKEAGLAKVVEKAVQKGDVRSLPHPAPKLPMAPGPMLLLGLGAYFGGAGCCSLPAAAVPARGKGDAALDG